jgi:diaminopimelate decarboxylase
VFSAAYGVRCSVEEPNPAGNHACVSVRAGCEGVVPLPARLEPWQVALCEEPGVLAEWLDVHGSPLNVIDPGALMRNAVELQALALEFDIHMKIFFARKANKSLTLVDEARRLGLGLDLASEVELRQALDAGVPAADLVVTAAIKPRPLLELCVASGATVVIDNEDELRLLCELADGSSSVPVALRLGPGLAGRDTTRFGLAPLEILGLLERYWPGGASASLVIAGVHFHLDGYSAADRVQALSESLEVVAMLREQGHTPFFVDIGGGIPMSYLDDGAAWERFWEQHRAALLGDRDPLTYDGHGLGLIAHAGEVIGSPNVYPAFQSPVLGEWMAQVLGAELDTTTGRQTVAEALRTRELQLRCEPGRALVDGCGLTAARVEFRKQRRDGAWLIGVAMNRTQCRSAADDFLVDPLLLRPPCAADSTAALDSTGPIHGYLVGAYCSERELLTWRRLHFPQGVEVGDIVVFPNTAGYLMHILESSSHQMPLARNLVVGAAPEPFLDAVDATGAESGFLA